ncbi:hypothetical protein RSAG8_09798, partial [Rhizoctonia solani AG-8 WAC10335]
MDFLGDSNPSNAEEWILFAQTKFSDVIQDLANIQPGLLEFLMSANEGIRNSVRSSLCGAAFPATRALWLNSIGCSLFQRFLTYFNRLPSSLNLVDRTIDETCRQVMPYMVVLSTLGQVQFPSTELKEKESTSQKRCQANISMCARQNTSTIDSRLFTVLDLRYPTTPQELQEVETQVFQRLEALLGVLIGAFEKPELGAYSRTLIFGTSQQIDQQSTLSMTADSSSGQFKSQIAKGSKVFLGSNDDMAQLESKPASRVVSDLDLAPGEWSSLVPSPETDWESTGRYLFGKRHYSQAKHCFEKANLPVERNIAAAYDSRKQARLLQVAQSVDRRTCCAAFTKAAADLLGCATLTTGKQKMKCYLHAAECYLQADDWTAAANAYYAANDFDMAASIFLREGGIEEAVEVVKEHRDDMLEKIVEEIVGIARLEYFRSNQLDPPGDEQLEYMENYGFTGALIRVLEYHGCHDRARKAIEKALRELWKLLPFGCTGDKRRNSAIDIIIDQLSGSRTLKDEETRELEAFQALRANDVEKLFALAQSSGKAAFSRLLIPHRNSTIPQFIEKAKLALSYINHLLRFTRSLDVSSLNAQKLLGFDPMESAEPGEGKSHSPEFWIHSTSLMFEDAQRILGAAAVPSSSALGLSSLAITELDTRRLALAVMYDAVRSEVRAMHNSANLGWYLYPCLEFAIFGRCNRSECGRQEVNSRDLPTDQRQAAFDYRELAL